MRSASGAAVGTAPVRGLPTAGRKQAAGGGPHVRGQSEDDGDGQRPEGKAEEQVHAPTSGNRSDCSPAGIWRSFRTACDTSRASDRIRSQSSPNRIRRIQHNPVPGLVDGDHFTGVYLSPEGLPDGVWHEGNKSGCSQMTGFETLTARAPTAADAQPRPCRALRLCRARSPRVSGLQRLLHTRLPQP